jgi:hypothetical protein
MVRGGKTTGKAFPSFSISLFFVTFSIHFLPKNPAPARPRACRHGHSRDHPVDQVFQSKIRFSMAVPGCGQTLAQRPG